MSVNYISGGLPMRIFMMYCNERILFTILLLSLRCPIHSFCEVSKWHPLPLITGSMMLILFLIQLSFTMAAGKRAIATLLSGSPNNAEKYTRLLHSFVYSLRNAGYDEEIVVLYADDFPIDAPKLSQVLNVKTKAVEKITVQDTNGKGNPHYASMLTKLHLWNLLEYSQVMYYDCDFVFQQNPASAFSECSWSTLCATADTGMHNFNKAIRPGTYFNAGFLVLRPNKVTYADLLAKQHLATNKFFVEQDLLNEVYKGKWGSLDQKYNLMHCYQLPHIESHIVAIHEKMWILRKSFPERHYVWNSSKMRVNYPISTLLTTSTGEKKNSDASKKKRTVEKVSKDDVESVSTGELVPAPAPKPSKRQWLNAKLPPKHKGVPKGSGKENVRVESVIEQPEATAVNGKPPLSSSPFTTKSMRSVNAVTKIDNEQTPPSAQPDDVANNPLQPQKSITYKRVDEDSRTVKHPRAFQLREEQLIPPELVRNNRVPRNYKVAHKSISEPRKRPTIIKNRAPQ